MAADERDLRQRTSSAADERATRTRGKQTVRKLLQAGRECLEEVGFADLRVDDVVKRAGTSHGTFYLYFSDKRDLLDALGADLAEELADVASSMPNLDADLESRQQLGTWLAELLRLLGGQQGVLRALLGDPEWDWRTLTADLEDTVRRRLDTARGLSNDMPGEQAAWAVAALVVGLAIGAPTDPSTQQTITLLLHRGLLPC